MKPAVHVAAWLALAAREFESCFRPRAVLLLLLALAIAVPLATVLDFPLTFEEIVLVTLVTVVLFLAPGPDERGH
jgi:hypothetical protein